MKVTVWSILSGRLSGHLVMNVPATHTLRKVLEAYCSNKGAALSNDYVIRSQDNHVLNLNKTLKQASIQDGESLMIGLFDDEKQTFAFGSWWLVTIVSFIIGFFGIACVVWLCFQIFPAPQQFGVVIDAGSSHSEVFIFSWHGDKPLGTAGVELVHRCFIADGINSFAGHTGDLQGYFEPCLRETESHIPASQRANTFFYLGATAGMRILQDFNHKGAEAILATLRQIFATNSAFKFNPEDVKIISGSEEGISGWIAVNYLAHNSTKNTATRASALDVGGASLQVTTDLAGQSTWQTTPVTLFNHTHRVFSKSFLCYGIGEAQQRYNFFLLNGNETSNRTKEEKADPSDPCLARGLTRQVSEAQLKGPCTLTDDSQPLLSVTSNINHSKLKRIFKSYKEKKDERQFKQNENATEIGSGALPFTLQGSSDAVKCEERVRQLFDKPLCESTFTYGDCMDAHSVPHIRGTLYMPCTPEEWRNVATEFEKKWHFPNCLGALDGKHIVIRAPAASGSYYYNYKGTHSIVLMAVVDANYVFLYADVGTNGRVSDGGVWNQCKLRHLLDSGEANVPESTTLGKGQQQVPYVLVADDAFPLTPYIMKPYNFRSQNEQKRIFSYRLSRARRTVEAASGILASRFRVLSIPIVLDPQKAEKIVFACIVLNNFLRLNAQQSTQSNSEDVMNQNGQLFSLPRDTGRNSSTDAKQIRQEYCRYFNQEGAVPWQ